MGRVSSRRINPEIEERIFEVFWAYLANLRNAEGIHEFLLSLLSQTEQVMLAKRLAIAILLSKNYNYEQIDETLKVSKATIATIQRQISMGAPGYEKALRQITTSENQEKLINNFEKLFIKLSPPKSYGSPSWQSKSKTSKRILKRDRQLNSV